MRFVILRGYIFFQKTIGNIMTLSAIEYFCSLSDLSYSALLPVPEHGSKGFGIGLWYVFLDCPIGSLPLIFIPLGKSVLINPLT